MTDGAPSLYGPLRDGAFTDLKYSVMEREGHARSQEATDDTMPTAMARTAQPEFRFPAKATDAASSFTEQASKY